jgi:hypothetical protein
MKSWALLAGILGSVLAEVPLGAQTSFDALEQDLQAAKQAHDAATSQSMTAFLAALDAASQTPEQALELYKEAGGDPPGTAPIKTHYDYETPTEKAAREAKDAASAASTATAIQLQCGMMHYAALFAVEPTAAGLQDGWINWLKTAGQSYPQMAGEQVLRKQALRDSIIGAYLAFHGWDDKDSGKWALQDIPSFYHDLILEPARKSPTAATLDLWDTYIAIRHADETDEDKWTREEEPAFEFERGADDFSILPSMDKLSTLMAIIKANPGNSQTDNWIARMETMIKTLKAGRRSSSSSTVAAPAQPSSEPFLPDAPDTPAKAEVQTPPASPPTPTP